MRLFLGLILTTSTSVITNTEATKGRSDMDYLRNVVKAESEAQEIASLCSMLRAYYIAGSTVPVTSSVKYTKKLLLEHLERLNDALTELGE